MTQCFRKEIKLFRSSGVFRVTSQRGKSSCRRFSGCRLSLVLFLCIVVRLRPLLLCVLSARCVQGLGGAFRITSWRRKSSWRRWL